MRQGYRALLALLAAAATAAAGPAAMVSGQGPNVLQVGPAGTPGAQFTSIQDAINHANPGDWVLVAPGVYHEKGSDEAGVLIQKKNIHLRGMNRNQVIVDGTMVSPTQRAGTLPAGTPACSNADNLQDLGKANNTGFDGLNGIEAKGFTGSTGTSNFVGNLADGVSIENLSVCNYLKSDSNGNEIWWNGGDGQGVSGLGALHGDYLTATSTYFKTATGPAGEYGIFTSNESGPGVIDHSYASNMRDSGFYIGACPNCNMILQNSRASANADGFSGTNAGGNLVIRNNEFDHGRTGLTSNSQNNDDIPSPQKGQCPLGVTPQVGAAGCTFWIGNRVHDNNNPNTPGSGLTAVSAIGSGMEMVATQHNTLVNNQVYNQGSWGIITYDFPDPESTGGCLGGNDVPAVPMVSPEICLYQSLGNVVAANTFTNVGYFGNPSNGDVADEAMYTPTGANPGALTDPNCFHNDSDTGGTVSQYPNTPVGLEGLCNGVVAQTTQAQKAILTGELVCATGAVKLFFPGAPATCPLPITAYPQYNGVCGTSDSPGVLTPAGNTTDGVCLLPLSTSLNQATMPDPCAGVPASSFCPGTTPNTILPNTAAAMPAPLAFALVGALGAVGLATVAVRRRRRPSSD